MNVDGHPDLPGDLDCAHALDSAVELLADLRGLYHHRGPAVHLHLIASLHHRLLRELLDAALAAYDDGHTPDDIVTLAAHDQS